VVPFRDHEESRQGGSPGASHPSSGAVAHGPCRPAMVAGGGRGSGGGQPAYSPPIRAQPPRYQTGTDPGAPPSLRSRRCAVCGGRRRLPASLASSGFASHAKHCSPCNEPGRAEQRPARRVMPHGSHACDYRSRGNVIDKDMLRPLQCRMARAALGWTLDETADHSGVNRRTILRYEQRESSMRRRI
jgi:hypothetical protein